MRTTGFACLLMLVALFTVRAADQPLSFADTVLQSRFEALLSELRCLVCQNQTLADSHAELAQDLRHEVFRLLSEGASDEDIHAFMVARYGDFVLYNPPVKKTTAALWVGPGALLLCALTLVYRRVSRSQQHQAVPGRPAMPEAESDAS